MMPDVVDLSDVLLPEGQYLEMFDLESDHPGDLSDAELPLKSPKLDTCLGLTVGCGLESIVSIVCSVDPT